MCISSIEILMVSVLNGVAGSVILGYRLNDQKRRAKNRSNNKTPLLLKNSESEILSDFYDFGSDDLVYEQFCYKDSRTHTAFGISESEKANNFLWRNNRPTLLTWIKVCAAETGKMVLFAGFFIGLLSIFITFIELNTTCICATTDWEHISKKLQWVRVISRSIEAGILQFSQYIIMLLVFGRKVICKFHLLLYLHIFAALIDIVSRILFQLYELNSTNRYKILLNLLFILVTVFSSFNVARTLRRKSTEKILLALQISNQFIAGTLTACFVIYVFIPWFVASTKSIRALVAAAGPLIGVPSKVIARISAQYMLGVNHPGTSYALVIMPYTATALLSRALQAQVDSLEIFTLICFAHGITGVFERASVILRDHFLVWLYRKCLRRERFPSYIGAFRTPRTQRLVADMHICNILLEVTTLIFSNCIMFLYKFHKSRYKTVIIVSEFLKRISIGIWIEYIFAVVSVFILTWCLNVPVINVWKKRWKRFLITNTIAVGLMLIFFIKFFVPVISGIINHQVAPAVNCSDTSNGVFF